MSFFFFLQSGVMTLFKTPTIISLQAGGGVTSLNPALRPSVCDSEFGGYSKMRPAIKTTYLEQKKEASRTEEIRGSSATLITQIDWHSFRFWGTLYFLTQ